MSDSISKRQFVALCFVGLLCPMIRRFPRILAGAAGRTAWLSVLLAVPLLALAGFTRLYRNRPAGTGYAEVLSDAFGPRAGKALVLLYAVFFPLYAGLLLRGGANRFVSLIYPGASPGVFTACLALACGLASAGSLKSLGRCAMVLRPLLAAAPVVIFFLTVKDADFGLLLPVLPASLPGDALGALPAANLFGVAVYLSFFGDSIADGPFRVRDYAGWLAAALGLLLLITAGCLGMFGPELTAKLNYPFFLLTRDVSVLGALERVEPVAIALWVFADFVLISALLWCAGRLFRRAFGLSAKGRWTGPLCAVLAAVAGFLMPEDADRFAFLSDRAVPLCCAGLAFLVPLAALAAGKLRKAS